MILADMQAVESLAAATRGTPSGRLRINAPVTFGIRVLSPRLLEYMVRYPQVSVDLTLSNELVDIVDHGYDVVFRIGELQASGLKAMPLEPYP
jgi:DNA-binding transcriptional LysR family regulator